MENLSLRQVSKQFGEQVVVSNVSLDVEPGAFLALLGPSGCGKTTLLRMVAGFEAPTAGSIHLGGHLLADGSRLLPPEQRNMAMVFQSYALWPHMTVADNVGYPLKVRGVSQEVYRSGVAAALDAVKLSNFADRRPAELSGGQRQRVALARCLVMHPKVVLLDEPLANLDRHLRQEMEETFRDFHRRSGATMIYVTHDQAEAMALATQVAVMAQGQLLQVAPPEEIYARPDGSVVGSLIGRGAILKMTLPSSSPREIDGSVIHAVLSSSQNSDGKVAVLVRPENVVVGADGVSAEVISCFYEGERYLMRLRLPDHQTLLGYSRWPALPGENLRLRIDYAWRL